MTFLLTRFGVVITPAALPQISSWRHPSNLPVLAAFGLLVIAVTVLLTMLTMTQDERFARADAQACEEWGEVVEAPAFGAAMDAANESERPLPDEHESAIRSAGMTAHRMLSATPALSGEAESVFERVSVTANRFLRGLGSVDEFVVAQDEVAGFCGASK